jgi:hypothetical protein
MHNIGKIFFRLLLHVPLQKCDAESYFSERWQKILENTEISFFTEMYLQENFLSLQKKSLFLVTNFLPTENVIQQIKDLKQGEALVYEDELVAAKINMDGFSLHQIEKMTDIKEELIFFKKPTDLFTYNKEAIDFDFALLTKGRFSGTFFNQWIFRK